MNEITLNWIWFLSVFVALAFAFRWLLRNARSDPGTDGGPPRRGAPSLDGPRSAPTSPFTKRSDVMVDPVSGQQVAAAEALAFFYQGRVHFFASQSNRERFIGDPSRYTGDEPHLQHPVGPGRTIRSMNGPHSRSNSPRLEACRHE